ncbi:hypothetical protein GCM10027605_23280 [Micromonospora zhanjiangensis]
MVAITPGASADLVTELLGNREHGEDAGDLALVLGLITGLIALTSTMAQIERGANRIYGVERDRPAHWKYLRAAVLAVCAGLPALLGFLMLAAGGPMGAAVQHNYAWGPVAKDIWNVVRWPTSLALTVFAVAVLFRHALGAGSRACPGCCSAPASAPCCGGWPACCWRPTSGSATRSARRTGR